MPLSPDDEALIADMKQREFHIKSRQRAVDAIQYQVRRYRTVLVALVGVVGGVVGAVVFLAADPERSDQQNWWLLFVNVLLGAVLGVLLGQTLLRTRWGRSLVARRGTRLGQKYTSELHAGRRWMRFYYEGEDISAYVPQILYFIESEGRFDSVHEALAFARANRQHSATIDQRALDRFNSIAAQTSLVAVSSTDEAGTPSIRPMRFVKSDRPGVWYVTTSPEGNKVRELDRGRIALLTQPTESGETISSNRVQVKRVAQGFPAVADLYRAQVPGYVDGLTDAEKQREVIYELTMRSAKIDSWLGYDLVEFDHPGLSSTG
jgi:uncharacterized membrane protein YeaQ/YmgE (transglycosylase-associated protein family)